jgi:hypothetical protein
MVQPGGLVLWHDYRGPRRAGGVFRALNELARERPLVRLEGTSLVAYRAPVLGQAGALPSRSLRTAPPGD